MGDLRFDVEMNVSADTLARIVVSLVESGEPILAVRMVRDALSCGLRQARDIVDVARNAHRSIHHHGLVRMVVDAIDGYCGI